MLHPVAARQPEVRLIGGATRRFRRHVFNGQRYPRYRFAGQSVAAAMPRSRSNAVTYTATHAAHSALSIISAML